MSGRTPLVTRGRWTAVVTPTRSAVDSVVLICGRRWSLDKRFNVPQLRIPLELAEDVEAALQVERWLW